jgi:hypothetical protein
MDRTLRTLANYDPRGGAHDAPKRRVSAFGQHKKSFGISKIDNIEPFLGEGPTNLCVVISWKLENQRPYDLEFQSAEDKAHFLALISQMTRDETSDRQLKHNALSRALSHKKNSQMGKVSQKGPGEGDSGSEGAEGDIHETAFLCDEEGMLMHSLPGWGDESSVWTKGYFSVLPDLEVLYMVDNVDMFPPPHHHIDMYPPPPPPHGRCCTWLTTSTISYRVSLNLWASSWLGGATGGWGGELVGDWIKTPPPHRLVCFWVLPSPRTKTGAQKNSSVNSGWNARKERSEAKLKECQKRPTIVSKETY